MHTAAKILLSPFILIGYVLYATLWLTFFVIRASLYLTIVILLTVFWGLCLIPIAIFSNFGESIDRYGRWLLALTRWFFPEFYQKDLKSPPQIAPAPASELPTQINPTLPRIS